MMNLSKTKNANNKVDELYKIWLGKRDLFQLFPDEILAEAEQIRDIQGLYELLDE
jgi:hypothetical protein